MKKIILMAHADDEFLFGFPVLKEAATLICCTDDKTHPTRQWCNKRSLAFAEVGRFVGVETICLRHDSGFHKKEHKDLRSFIAEVQGHISGADEVFTHNAWGEYGHLDHILLHQLVRASGKPMYTTDICMHADWYDVRAYDQGKVIRNCKNNMDVHERCMAIYHKHSAMGWPYPPIDSCNLIRVE